MTSTDRLAAIEQRLAYLEDQEKIREVLALLRLQRRSWDGRGVPRRLDR